MSSTLRHVIPLRLLAVGSTATIVEVDGQPDVVGRLHEMGLRPGCDIRMLRSGGACIVAIDNHRFGFRGAEAAHVLVEVGGNDADYSNAGSGVGYCDTSSEAGSSDPV